MSKPSRGTVIYWNKKIKELEQQKAELDEEIKTLVDLLIRTESAIRSVIQFGGMQVLHEVVKEIDAWKQRESDSK